MLDVAVVLTETRVTAERRLTRLQHQNNRRFDVPRKAVGKSCVLIHASRDQWLCSTLGEWLLPHGRHKIFVGSSPQIERKQGERHMFILGFVKSSKRHVHIFLWGIKEGKSSSLYLYNNFTSRREGRCNSRLKMTHIDLCNLYCENSCLWNITRA